MSRKRPFLIFTASLAIGLGPSPELLARTSSRVLLEGNESVAQDLKPTPEIVIAPAQGNLAPGSIAAGNFGPSSLASVSSGRASLAPGQLDPGSLAPGNFAPSKFKSIAPASAKPAPVKKVVSKKKVLGTAVLAKLGLEAKMDKSGRIEVLVLGDASTRFLTGKTEINPTAESQLEKLAATLKEHGFPKFRVDGHADIRGSYVMNQRLSDLRARNVAATLVKLGVPAESLVAAKGWSSDKPLVQGSGREVWGRNRRVEIRIVTDGEASQLTLFQPKKLPLQRLAKLTVVAEGSPLFARKEF